MKMTKDMTQGNPISLILKFSIPLILGNLFQQLYNMVDTIIVGRALGLNSLTAVAATTSLNFLIVGFVLGVCSGLAIPVAQRFGAGDYKKMRNYVANAAYVAIAMALVITVVTTGCCHVILRWMKTPESIFAESYAYFWVICLGIPFTFLYNTVSGIIRALGDSRTPFYFLVISTILNIVLDLVFIITLHWGVAGAAWATIIAQALSGFMCLIYMKKKYAILKSTREERKLNFRAVGTLLMNGVPMGLQYSITAIGSVVIQTAINGLGTAAVAAVTAGSKLNGFFACVFDALATTMATFAGQNIGARKLKRVHQGLKAAGIMGGVYCVLVFAVMVLFGRQLLGLFVKQTDVQVIDLAYRYMCVNTACFLLLLGVNIYRLTIQGMGFTRIAMLAGVMEMVARTAVAMILVPIFGFNGACASNPAAWLFADIFLIPCYLRITKKLEHRLQPAGDNI